ncbi:MAG: D-alanyl-D-alanine carboxypeptidase/D-alanyl-D-alanine-endopeptidase, partial [Phycisphaerae bacterium]|nr:D-alanyl-D-alanine carboxypeptidase/D-alanyl-D-alanine-endopeptidase [Phycisphaerae bacterium]
SRVRSVLDDSKLGQARIGVVILDGATGEVLASARGDESFIPASNMKLLTSGAALAVLGKDFKFETSLVYDEAAPGGRVVLRGGGDPALGDPKLLQQSKTSVEWVLTTWVDAMKSAGVPAGAELVIDDRVFDRQYVHPSWPAEQLNRWYCAEVSGLNFHTNLISIFAEPREAGRPPSVKTEPISPWIEIRNRAKSVKQGNHTAWAARDGDRGIMLYGDVRFSNDPVDVSLTDVPSYMARLLGDRMASAGMRPSRVRVAEENENLDSGRVLHTFSTDIATALRRCNVDSYNLYAECFIKRLGHEVTHAPGSWTNGSAVMRMVLQEHLGIDAGRAFTVADGSGMSRNNRVTPRMLALWLKAMADDERTGDAFLASLAQAGEEGTLRRRFRGQPLVNDVRAKTGYLSGVSAISGYVTESKSGRRLIFSIITNDKPNRVQLTAIREAEEKIIRIVDGWVSSRGAVAPGAAGVR